MDDNKNKGYGLDGNTGYGLNGNTGYGLNSGDDVYNNSNNQFEVSNEKQEEYEEARKDDTPAYITEREDDYKNRINNLLESVSIGENRVPNPEYDREYTPERAESLLNSLNSTKKEDKKNSHSWYDLPVYEVLDKQKTVVSAKEQSSISFDKLKQIGKYIAIAAVSGAITITAIAGVKSPDPVVPEKNPQTMELEEKINNAENFDEVIDIINDHKEFNKNVYDGSDSYEDTESKGGRGH